MSDDAKWQPLMAIVDGGRIQCVCDSLAVIMCGTVTCDDEKHLAIKDASFWCQPCYIKVAWPDEE